MLCDFNKFCLSNTGQVRAGFQGRDFRVGWRAPVAASQGGSPWQPWAGQADKTRRRDDLNCRQQVITVYHVTTVTPDVGRSCPSTRNLVPGAARPGTHSLPVYCTVPMWTVSARHICIGLPGRLVEVGG